jgi:hypothetical protein
LHDHVVEAVTDEQDLRPVIGEQADQEPPRPTLRQIGASKIASSEDKVLGRLVDGAVEKHEAEEVIPLWQCGSAVHIDATCCLRSCQKMKVKVRGDEPDPGTWEEPDQVMVEATGA